MMTWCAPSSMEPLPLNERHHIWLAVKNESCELRSTGKNRASVWSAHDDEYLKDHYLSCTHAEMAAALGRSVAAVQIRCGYFGLNKRALWADVEDRYLIENHSHESFSGMAKHLGRTVDAVKVRCLKLGLMKYKNGRSPREYTDDELSLVKDLIRSPTEVAELIGRTPASVIAKRRKLGISGGLE